MRLHFIFALALLSAVLALLATSASAQADQGEINSLTAIASAFPELTDVTRTNPAWTSVNLAGVCSSTNLQGVLCGMVPGEGNRPISMYVVLHFRLCIAYLGAPTDVQRARIHDPIDAKAYIRTLGKEKACPALQVLRFICPLFSCFLC